MLFQGIFILTFEIREMNNFKNSGLGSLTFSLFYNKEGWLLLMRSHGTRIRVMENFEKMLNLL